ncbi:MAG TPA: hypothetical protein PLP73_00025 [Candidatus Absconditabacterales bacterium]|nr:hypothetical protein [Candidatus Absconditabacterales bacterium]
MSRGYDFPFQREYNLNIKIEVNFKLKNQVIEKVLKYKQATIKETLLELEEIENNGIDKYFLKVLKENGFEDGDITLFGLDQDKFNGFVVTYLTTRFRGVIDKDQLEKSMKENAEKVIEQKSGVPYSAILALVSDKLNIDPLTFQERYTMEQLTYMLAGIEYWANEQTEEGQQKNKQKYGQDAEYDHMLLERLRKV